MAFKSCLNNKQLARVATKGATCSFCGRDVDDEHLYGKLYAIGDIQCHYFCALLSSCLVQHGKEEEGLFGFLYSDILAEIERSKKHRCSYCNHSGATLGCFVTKCKKQFHLPCGREKNAVSMFHGNYKSYCQRHAPKQKISGEILDCVKKRRQKLGPNPANATLSNEAQEMVCVICYEAVDAFPTINTFWPPCCARDAWLHRSCLQRMALNAGVHYLKCPLCNDKEQFYDALLSQGFYIPDRDAAWELEQNAFAEIYERRVVCNIKECKCPSGIDYDVEEGPWDIRLCLLCGSVGAHVLCAEVDGDIYVCSVCQPAAPNDPKYLEAINAVTLPEPNPTPRRPSGPIMPCRMSIRRTKPRLHKQSNTPSTSYAANETIMEAFKEEPSQYTLDSQPKCPTFVTALKHCDSRLLSPIKLLERRLNEKLQELKALDTFEWDSSCVVDLMQDQIKKPKPLSVKRNIVNKIIDNTLEDIINKIRNQEPCSNLKTPKNICIASEQIGKENEIPVIEEIRSKVIEGVSSANDVKTEIIDSNILTEEFLDKNLPIQSIDQPIVMQKDSSMEISERGIDISSENKEKVSLKFSPDKDVLCIKNIDMDMESFKHHYLSEVDRDSRINRIESNFDADSINKVEKVKDKFKNRIKRSSTDKGKLRSNTDTESIMEVDCETILEDGSINQSNIRKYKRKSNKRFHSEKKHNSIADNESNKKYKSDTNKSIVLNFAPDGARGKKKRCNNEVSIRNKSIEVNIKWKKEKLKLKITNSKRKKQNYRQYIFEKYKNNIAMSPGELPPQKRKYTKNVTATDNLKQTLIDTFFVNKNA
ncbi:unnamed protein product [Leptosia nina]|uniref:PHD-type domain-containing protein n=1 Tax=Leptosia nina TaxID=320188 RepID=A0AAV1JUP8_9NEOP